MSHRQLLTRKNTGVERAYPERIVQFGAGNFIRAFVDWMIEELNEKCDFASSSVVVKVTPHGNYDTLDAQDGLYHVHTEGIQNGKFISHTKLITCINRTVYPYDDFQNFLDLARQAEIRFLFSNTTEMGITYNESDEFSREKPASSFPGKLTQFLYERYQYFAGVSDKGCIILPTELVVDNGSQLKDMVLQYAKQWELDSNFTDWIEQHNIFCNTLVDRIVPGYPEDKSEAILDAIGYDDRLLVMGEPYHSFIIAAPENIKKELPFHRTNLNVKIVEDVDRYRKIKVRILNGIHSSMVYLAYLLGFETVRESVEDPDLGAFLKQEAQLDIIPSMNLPEAELLQFTQDVFDRFRNPAIHHRLLSIAMNGSTKMRTRILPSLIAYHAKFGELPPRIVLVFAAFIRFYKGEWQGEVIPLNDDETVIAWFDEQWHKHDNLEQLVNTILRNTDLWETDLTQIEGLQKQLVQEITTIKQGKLLERIQRLNG